MAYPSTVSNLPDPQASDRLNNPSHSTLHRSENAEIEAIQTFVGTIPASAVGTLIYDIRSPDSNGGGHIQSANKGGTGQTSYNKGDLLVGQSNSVLAKLAVGGDGQVLIANSGAANGVSWGSGAIPTVRTYTIPSVTGTSSFVGHWFKPSTLSYITVEIVGGGAGGGNGQTGGGTINGAGAGGGAGGYARKTVAAASLPLAASVMVGSGGNASSDGLLSLFGSVLSATGGGAASGITPGIGGLGVNGDINSYGGSGGPGQGATAAAAATSAGQGGNSYFGGGSRGPTNADAVGNPGSVIGGGGSGGYAASNTQNNAGGRGAAGFIAVYEY